MPDTPIVLTPKTVAEFLLNARPAEIYQMAKALSAEIKSRAEEFPGENKIIVTTLYTAVAAIVSDSADLAKQRPGLSPDTGIALKDFRRTNALCDLLDQFCVDHSL